MNNIIMGRALKIIRLYHNMNKIELGHELSLTPIAIGAIENGNSKILSIEILKKYSEYFSIKLSSLLIFVEFAENKKYSPRHYKYKIVDKVLSILEWFENSTGDENE